MGSHIADHGPDAVAEDFMPVGEGCPLCACELGFWFCLLSRHLVADCGLLRACARRVAPRSGPLRFLFAAGVPAPNSEVTCVAIRRMSRDPLVSNRPGHPGIPWQGASVPPPHDAPSPCPSNQL